MTSFCFLLNPLLERMWVLLIKICVNFQKNILVTERSQCKALSIGRHLEISSLLLIPGENIKTLTFVSLKLCFLSFVHHHNELFFSYMWSFVHKFTSSSKNPSWLGRIPTHCSIIIDTSWVWFCWGVWVQSNIFVARVLHFSAFIYLCIC